MFVNRKQKWKHSLFLTKKRTKTKEASNNDHPIFQVLCVVCLMVDWHLCAKSIVNTVIAFNFPRHKIGNFLKSSCLATVDHHHSVSPYPTRVLGGNNSVTGTDTTEPPYSMIGMSCVTLWSESITATWRSPQEGMSNQIVNTCCICLVSHREGTTLS